MYSFTQNGEVLDVTEASCVSKDTSACAMCTLPTLSPTDPAPTASDQAVGESGCSETTITCAFGTGNTGVMEVSFFLKIMVRSKIQRNVKTLKWFYRDFLTALSLKKLKVEMSR